MEFQHISDWAARHKPVFLLPLGMFSENNLTEKKDVKALKEHSHCRMWSQFCDYLNLSVCKYRQIQIITEL